MADYKKLTEEILDFNTVEDFTRIKADYKQKQKVRFECKNCKESVIRPVDRIAALLSKQQFNFLCRNCQRKETSRKLYGCDSPSQSKSTKDKNRQTRLERYGAWNSEKQKESIKAFYTDTDKVAKAAKRRELSCLEKYGVTNANKSQEVRNKIRETCQKRFGTTSSLSAEIVKAKIRKTIKERYQVDNAHKSKQVIDKTKQTCLEKYGTESALGSSEVQVKIKATLMDRYGVENPSQSWEIQKRKTRKYTYQEVNFDSSWELALWIYAKDHNEQIEREPCYFEYSVNGTLHRVYPDFRYKGELVEIKGDQFFTDSGELRDFYRNSSTELLRAKFDCEIQNNVKFWKKQQIQPFLDYIQCKYGKDYLQSFRNN